MAGRPNGENRIAYADSNTVICVIELKFKFVSSLKLIKTKS